MEPLRILSVVGCRPNIIKIAPLIREMKRHPQIFPCLVHTGQHYDDVMSSIFFRDLELPPPDMCLNIGSGSSLHQMSLIVERLEEVLREMDPDLVLVVGDVTSTAASSLAATTLGFPVAHVEAGLRSFDRGMPEEINRVLTDAISCFLFATEESAVRNLLHEGKRPEEIFFVGNVMIDTLVTNANKIEHSPILRDLGVTSNTYGVVTLHRKSNVEECAALGDMCEALEQLQHRIRLVFPIHPRTAECLQRFGCWTRLTSLPNIQIVEPLGYLDFIKLMKESVFLLTDSGGVQEESTVLGVPCLTLRENTERPVTITHGTNQLVGTQKDKIVEKGLQMIDGVRCQGGIPEKWDGHASERIIAVLLDKVEAIKGHRRSVSKRETCAYLPGHV